MFQNINQDTMKNSEINEKKKIIDLGIISNVFEVKNIVIYVIAFMLALVGLNGDFSIFSLSLLAACFATGVPAIGVILVSLVGNVISHGIEGVLGYFLTALILVISMLIFKPKYNEEERNEKIKIGKNVFIATILIQIIGYAFTEFTLYDVLSSVTISTIALIFYKIFVNSVNVLQDVRERRAFTIEEVIGASIIVSIAFTALGDINIFGIVIRNVLSILIVMILGWKNGVLVGTTAGVTIGVTLGVITGTEPLMIAAYAISGMIAGMLNRFGKIGVVVGFVSGNILLAYVSNGYTVELILFKEILVASIGLLAIPKKFSIDIEEFLGNSKLLPPVPNRGLNRNREVAESLNNVSQVIGEMATTYSVGNLEMYEDIEVAANKQIFVAELLNNLEPYRKNLIYEDITDINGEILQNIFEELVGKQEISVDQIIEIFTKCKVYIVGLDDSESSKTIKETLEEIVRIINFSYRVSKSDFIWRKKTLKNQKAMEKQLNNVSKAIKDIAKDFEEKDKEEEKWNLEKLQIVEEMNKNDIRIQEMSIVKKSRFHIEIYTEDILNIKQLDLLEKITTEILKEKIVLNAEATLGKKVILASDDIYIMAIGTSGASKSQSEVSGDSILNIKLKDGKYLIAISDGMGTGKNAKKSSLDTLKLLENLLISGFDKNTSLELVNTLLMNRNEEMYATLDIMIVDLYLGTMEFIKSGACPTYLKNGKKVQIIKSNSLPTGIVEEANAQIFDKDMVSGDIILMCSDGIIDSNIEYKNKELWVKYVLEDIETTNTSKIADLILNEAIDNNFGVAKDDMSIIVCKFKKK